MFYKVTRNLSKELKMFPDDEEEEYLSIAEMDADSADFLGCMAYSGNVRGDDGRVLDEIELPF